jgi:ribosomal protein S18 acetylase RimI-like enzyme
LNAQVVTSNLENLLIRTATHRDLPALEWGNELKHFRRLFADAYDRSTKGEAFIWIAELLDRGVIGQLIVSFTSSRPELADGSTRAYIYGVRVQSEYRNQGVGTRLMLTTETDLSQRGFLYATLNVGRQNPKAQRLYERLGYRVVDTEPGHWSYLDENGIRRDVYEPAWRMEKRLKD